MILLPTKHIPEEHTLLGAGAVLLAHLRGKETVTSLWDKVRANPFIGTYGRFILAIDFLYISGLIQYEKGSLSQVTS